MLKIRNFLNQICWTIFSQKLHGTTGLLPENRLEVWFVTLSLNMIMGIIEICPILLDCLSNVVHSIFYHSMVRFWTVIFLPTMHIWDFQSSLEQPVWNKGKCLENIWKVCWGGSSYTRKSSCHSCWTGSIHKQWERWASQRET